jgi:hypothetical protein
MYMNSTYNGSTSYDDYSTVPVESDSTESSDEEKNTAQSTEGSYRWGHMTSTMNNFDYEASNEKYVIATKGSSSSTSSSSMAVTITSSTTTSTSGSAGQINHVTQTVTTTSTTTTTYTSSSTTATSVSSNSNPNYQTSPTTINQVGAWAVTLTLLVAPTLATGGGIFGVPYIGPSYAKGLLQSGYYDVDAGPNATPIGAWENFGQGFVTQLISGFPWDPFIPFP